MKKNFYNAAKLIVSTLFAAWAVGCASTGENYDQSKVSQIKKGETTEADLIRLFGEPQGRGTTSEGSSTLTWQYVETRVKGESFIPYAGAFMGGARSSHKTLEVTLGTDGKVASFRSSTGGMESRSNQVQDVPKK